MAGSVSETPGGNPMRVPSSPRLQRPTAASRATHAARSPKMTEERISLRLRAAWGPRQVSAGKAALQKSSTRAFKSALSLPTDNLPYHPLSLWACPALATAYCGQSFVRQHMGKKIGDGEKRLAIPPLSPHRPTLWYCEDTCPPAWTA